MEFISILALAFVSFFAGLLDSIAGGGGLLMIPSLLLAGIPAQAALGTNKFVGSFGTSIAAGNFIHKKKVVLKIILSGIVFAFNRLLSGLKADSVI